MAYTYINPVTWHTAECQVPCYFEVKGIPQEGIIKKIGKDYLVAVVRQPNGKNREFKIKYKECWFKREGSLTA